MGFLWISISCLVALVWVLTIVDIVRQHYPGWTTAGWVALVLILPLIGSLIYWYGRKATPEDLERQALAEADRRRG